MLNQVIMDHRSLCLFYIIPEDQYNLTDSVHKRTGSTHLLALSGPASGIAPLHYHSTRSGYNTTPILHPHTAPENAGDRWGRPLCSGFLPAPKVTACNPRQFDHLIKIG